MIHSLIDDTSTIRYGEYTVNETIISFDANKGMNTNVVQPIDYPSHPSTLFQPQESSVGMDRVSCEDGCSLVGDTLLDVVEHSGFNVFVRVRGIDARLGQTRLNNPNKPTS